MANPPIDDVFKECFAAMNDGAGFFKKTVSEEAFGVLKARYFKNFLMQLNGGADFDELALRADPLTRGDLGWVPRGYLLEPGIEEALHE